MLPVTAGARRTKIEMFIYTLLLFPLSLTPAFIGIAGRTYLVGASILGGLFILCSIRVLLDPTYRAARQMFGFSILYLTLLFGLLLLEPAFKVWA